MKVYIVIKTKEQNECEVKAVFRSFQLAIREMKRLQTETGEDHDIIEREVIEGEEE